MAIKPGTPGAAFAALASALLCAGVFAGDAQERLKKEAAAQLLSLNDEMLKALDVKPEELEGKSLYAKAKAVERPDGSVELKVESLSVGEPAKADGAKAPGREFNVKGKLVKEPGRVWKLSIEDALPKEREPAKDGAVQGAKNEGSQGK